jgi:hypothetical protein
MRGVDKPPLNNARRKAVFTVRQFARSDVFCLRFHLMDMSENSRVSLVILVQAQISRSSCSLSALNRQQATHYTSANIPKLKSQTNKTLLTTSAVLVTLNPTSLSFKH